MTKNMHLQDAVQIVNLAAKTPLVALVNCFVCKHRFPVPIQSLQHKRLICSALECRRAATRVRQGGSIKRKRG